MWRTLRVLGSLSEESIPSAQRETLLEVFQDWKAGR